MATRDQTNTFTADNIGNPDAVFVDNFDEYGSSSGIRKVKIWENAAANTTSYIVHEPLQTSPGVTVPVGESYTFTKSGGGCYGCREIAGYVETVDVASATFAKQEIAL
jgi:hypothetical protein